MLKRLRLRLSRIGFLRKAVEEPADLGIFKEKPSVEFLIGISIVGLSYLIAWPLISVLGIVALYFRKPLIFVVGSPVAYGTSHIVFWLGFWLAGKDSITYMNVFGRWFVGRLCRKLLMISEPDSLSTEENEPISNDYE